MPRFEWDPSLSLGDAMIDRQHKSWIDLLNQADESCQNELDSEGIMNCLTGMYLYAKDHFFDEESLMERLGYPGRERHKELHKAFVDKTHALTDACLQGDINYQELLDFMTRWLKEHITLEDARIVEYANVKGELES